MKKTGKSDGFVFFSAGGSGKRNPAIKRYNIRKQRSFSRECYFNEKKNYTKFAKIS